MPDIETRFRQLVAETLSVDPATVTSETTFVDDLGADSLDFVELLMGAECEFSIEIDEDAAERVKTFGDAVRMVEEHKNLQGVGG